LDAVEFATVTPTVHHAIDVAATPEACWKVLTNLGTWPRWFPFLKYAGVLGTTADPWFVGGRFEIVFEVGPVHVSVKPVVQQLERAKVVRWIGKGWGVQGDHSYTLETHAPGLTRVTSHETFTGLGSRLLRGKVFDRLDEAGHLSMSRYKSLVEDR
jgi:hypothetical protein